MKLFLKKMRMECCRIVVLLVRTFKEVKYGFVNNVSLGDPKSNDEDLDESLTLYQVNGRDLTSPSGNENVDGDEQNILVSKNGQETWMTTPQQRMFGRAPAKNVMRVRQGPSAISRRSITEEVDSPFDLIFRRSLMDLIIKWTNKKGRETFGDSWKDLDKEELRCYLGLLILAGVYKGVKLLTDWLTSRCFIL